MSATSSPSVVDTNVILRYLLQDDEKLHERARAFLLKVREGDELAYFPESVIAECTFVLERRYNVRREEIADLLSGLLSFRGVDAENRALLQSALALYGSRNVDFVDALIAATAHRRGWRVFSFDRDLERLAK